MEIVYVVLLMAFLGIVFGLVLGFFSKKFAVKIDERIEKVTELLPGINCGACGYAGCAGLAEAIVSGPENLNLCSPADEETRKKVADYLGIDLHAKEKTRAMIYCQGSRDKAPLKYYIQGLDDCNTAVLLHAGIKQCEYGCLVLYSCVKECPFDAIYVAEDGLPKVDPEKCTSCGKCVPICPKDLIKIIPSKSKVHILCCSHDKGAVTNKVCKVGCIACMKCVKICPVDAISMQDNLAIIDYDKCIVCGKCVDVCPKNVIINEKKEEKEKTNEKISQSKSDNKA